MWNWCVFYEIDGVVKYALSTGWWATREGAQGDLSARLKSTPVNIAGWTPGATVIDTQVIYYPEYREFFDG